MSDSHLSRPTTPSFPSETGAMRDTARSREEWVTLHDALGRALDTDDPTLLVDWGRRWEDLCDLVDKCDYWERRAVYYHNHYLNTKARMHSAVLVSREATHRVRQLEAQVNRLEADLRRVQYDDAMRAHSSAVDRVQRSIAAYGDALYADAANRHEIQRVLAEDERRRAAGQPVADAPPVPDAPPVAQSVGLSGSVALADSEPVQ
ncbi:hypothetical protein EXIGLDRAFT_769492 [Exidia glandulosa HHB12029]|uniref:Uncharacterized protein n=1 Tax=Exidia glandulosa HHB12029 TaxID=1314781 RepID=A0A165HFU1_EXIGL|nr:hypothetical protein EXIGLDRAFT_769492 [Exidia glandulosa HHB12029]